jgi:hypothetical protein
VVVVVSVVVVVVVVGVVVVVVVVVQANEFTDAEFVIPELPMILKALT